MVPVESAVTVTPAQLPELLLHVAVVRPVFLWGAPGIGKCSLVREFADSLGLECVTLLGTQLAPEDLIGVPQMRDGRSRFAPPEAIARDEPYCLFLDELNASSPEVQKAFYSLILDRRIGEYELPEGSIVIGAGNRATDNALARPMASALVNRLVHVHLRASVERLAGLGGRRRHPPVGARLPDRAPGPPVEPSRRRPRSRSPPRAPGTCSPTPALLRATPRRGDPAGAGAPAPSRPPRLGVLRVREDRPAPVRSRRDPPGRRPLAACRDRTATCCTSSPSRSGPG